MQAYAILSGGGVKGAALAGCLAAAADHDIEFEGYGGTSAGSIVALLAAIGYKSDRIADLMKNGRPLHPMAILEDEGQLLTLAQKHLEDTLKIIYSDSGKIRKAFDLNRIQKAAAAVSERIRKSLGLYNGSRLRQILLDLVKDIKPDLKNHARLTFEDLEQHGCPPVKIVASDIFMRSAAIFERTPIRDPGVGHRIFGQDVIDAVRASSGYPFLFQPEVLADGTQLVDGGLSSNLPTFLFVREQELTRYPVVAFNLVTEEGPAKKDSPLVRFGKELTAAALEASDRLLVRLMPNVHLVEVPIPVDITTLKFDLSDTDIDRLYNAGYREASTSLAKWNRLTEIQQEKKKPKGILDLPQQLKAVNGPDSLFELPLRSVTRMIEELTAAREVRAQVMLPTNLGDGSRIVVYHHGFRPYDADIDMILGEYAGCTGRALKTRLPAMADLADAKTNYAKWGLTARQQAKVAPDRQSMFSVPIFAWTRERSRIDDLPILGILSVDSSTPLMDTGWVKSQDAETEKRALRILTQWADVISKLLR